VAAFRGLSCATLVLRSIPLVIRHPLAYHWLLFNLPVINLSLIILRWSLRFGLLFRLPSATRLLVMPMPILSLINLLKSSPVSKNSVNLSFELPVRLTGLWKPSE
jgi:hypothetical protein